MSTNDEIWLLVVGYDGVYEVSNLGRIKALQITLPHYKSGTMIRKEKFLKPWSKDGYRIVGLSINRKVKTYSVHRIVALSHISNPDNLPEVNHKDGNKSNNSVSNLEWCDRTHNHNHAMAMGLIVMPKGENHGMSKLTEYDVLEIRNTYKKEKRNGTSLSRIYGISKCSLSAIVNRRTWKHI